MAKFLKERQQSSDGWTRWVPPRMKGYKMACCDCGLVHDMQFKIVPYGRGFKVVFRAKRNQRSTGQMRRHRKE